MEIPHAKLPRDFFKRYTMKIAHIAPTRERCGVATFARDFEKELRKFCEIDVIETPNITQSASLQSLAKRLKAYDLVHIQHHPDFYGYWRLPERIQNWVSWIEAIPVPTVVTVHDLMPRLHPRACSNLKNILFNLMIAPVINYMPVGKYLRGGFLKNTTHLMALSEQVRNYLIDFGIPAAQISVFYPGIPHLKLSQYEFRKQYNLEKRRIITQFGFIRKNKGIETALEALAQIPSDIVLVLAGTPADSPSENYFESLKNQMTKLNLQERVIVTGYVDSEKIPDILSQSDALLLPYDATLQTGTSYALSYALASRRPVIVSDTPVFSEMKSQCPSLHIFPHGNSHSLAGVVKDVLSHPQDPHFSDPFLHEWSWAASAKKTYELYQRILRDRA